MTHFRPCIDLHEGKVKQIVGSTLSEGGAGVSLGPDLTTNFVSDKPARWFAELYQRDALTGGHVIMLGKGNDVAAREALAAYPGGLQVGGGINPGNAKLWLDDGATHVIVTSWLFDEHAKFQQFKLDAMVKAVGVERLVIDLSCKATVGGWVVAMNRWQTLTDLVVDRELIDRLAPYCAEFLIHAVDVEGKCQGIDEALVRCLGVWCDQPVTYAGGARDLNDLARVQQLSAGKADVTIGSALDIFGGSASYEDCVAFNSRNQIK
jgi:phosphoribosylformimino-5-aminoimidazole carboxamide ribotide isomerase